MKDSDGLTIPKGNEWAKKAIKILVITFFVLAGAFLIIASDAFLPNPGHRPSEIGNGTFNGTSYTFRLDATINNLLRVGIVNASSEVYVNNQTPLSRFAYNMSDGSYNSTYERFSYNQSDNAQLVFNYNHTLTSYCANGICQGNLQVNGNFTVIGSYTNVNVTNAFVNGSLLTPVNNTFTIGSQNSYWSTIYVKTLNFLDKVSYGKLDLSNSIVNADIATNAAIAESKIALSYATAGLFQNVQDVNNTVLKSREANATYALNTTLSQYASLNHHFLHNQSQASFDQYGKFWYNQTTGLSSSTFNATYDGYNSSYGKFWINQTKSIQDDFSKFWYNQSLTTSGSTFNVTYDLYAHNQSLNNAWNKSGNTIYLNSLTDSIRGHRIRFESGSSPSVNDYGIMTVLGAVDSFGVSFGTIRPLSQNVYLDFQDLLMGIERTGDDFWQPGTLNQTAYFGTTQGGTTGNIGILFIPNGTRTMYLSPTGNVGIGTSSPSNKLDVRGVGNFSGNLYVGNQTLVNIWLYNQSLSTATSIWNKSGSSIFQSDYSNNLVLYNGSGNPRFILNTTFDGGSSTDIEFIIMESGTSGTAESMVDTYTDASGSGSIFGVRKAGGTYENPSALPSGHTMGIFSFRGYDGNIFTGSKAGIVGITGGAWTTTSTPTILRLATTPSDSTTLTTRLQIQPNGFTEVFGNMTINKTLTIGDDGKVGIGTTSPTHTLNVVGDINFSRLIVNNRTDVTDLITYNYSLNAHDTNVWDRSGGNIRQNDAADNLSIGSSTVTGNGERLLLQHIRVETSNSFLTSMLVQSQLTSPTGTSIPGTRIGAWYRVLLSNLNSINMTGTIFGQYNEVGATGTMNGLINQGMGTQLNIRTMNGSMTNAIGSRVDWQLNGYGNFTNAYGYYAREPYQNSGIGGNVTTFLAGFYSEDMISGVIGTTERYGIYSLAPRNYFVGAEIVNNFTVNYTLHVKDGLVGIRTATPRTQLEVNGNITVQGNIIPTLNKTFDLGNQTSRWNNTYTANSYVGDLIFKNNLRFVEPDDSHITLKSASGTNLLTLGENGLTLHGNGNKPTCTESLRGTLWFTRSGLGAADITEICSKSALDIYSWRALSFV